MAEELVIVNKADLEVIGNTMRSNSGTTDKYSVAEIADAIANSIVPNVSDPYKQLVTDASGKTVWEDRLAYTIAGNVLLDKQSVTLEGLAIGEADVKTNLPSPFAEGETYFVEYTGYNSFKGEVVAAICSNGNYGLKFTGDGLGMVEIASAAEAYIVHISDTAGSGEYTLSISTTSSIKPIDPEYLPDNIGGVSSWNDLTDKPFGDVEEWVSIYNTLVMFTTQDNGYANAPITDDFGRYGELTAGKEYKVIYDGTEYVLTAHDADRDFEGYEGEAMSYFVGLGDINLVETPFYIERYYMNNIANGHRIWNNGTPYVAVQICEKRAVSKPIPDEYLPVPMTVVYASGETLYSDKACSSALTVKQAKAIGNKQGFVLVVANPTSSSAKMEIAQSYYYDVVPDAYVFATVSTTYNVT